MRTTVTLDDDLYLAIQTQARQLRKPFKVVLNEILRLGVQVRHSKAKKVGVQLKTYPMGLPEGLSYDNIGELLEQLEGPLHQP
ncbi:DUF2191 domain-containing protein [bacterium]|nr:DUF2191 domain-containing protein [bacterium]